jgi:acyl-CoA synthetase (AMP-forming)/AMP-acid ligase II
VYATDPDKTAAAHLRPGVFTIGEIGYVDDDGYVYITDRFSDMIVAGGVNIYPAEAEAVIITHPRVADVAVIGVPDADLGEAVHALVVPIDPADPPRGRVDRLAATNTSRVQVPAHGGGGVDRWTRRNGQGEQAGPAGALLGEDAHRWLTTLSLARRRWCCSTTPPRACGASR